MSRANWEAFHGICYHQTVPGQDHWDMGKVNHAKLRSYLDGARPISPLPQNQNEIPMTPGLHSTLSEGDEGDETERLQTLLNLFFEAGLEVDGKFGAATEVAVQAAQDQLGVEADGFWGALTAHTFDAWKVQLANASAAGLTGLETDEVQGLVREQWQSHRIAMDALDEVQAQLAALFTTIPEAFRDPDILGNIQTAQDAIKAISSARKEIKRLVKD